VEDIDVPVVEVMPVVGHGTVPVVGTTGDWLCTVIFGSGLRPPVASSVDPIGIPTRALDREAKPDDEVDAVALEDAVALLAHVPEAVPDTPLPSNKAVGADIPVADVPVIPLVPAVDPLVVPAIDVPGLEAVGCADAPTPEHVAADVIEPSAEVPPAAGLMPGAASSVAPSGIPVVPTDAPGPMPSGEVTPSEPVVPVTIPTWAIAGPPHNKGHVTATIKKGLMEIFLIRAETVVQAARRSGGAMNSGPTGSLIVSCRIWSISAIAEPSMRQPVTSAIGES
jgi:hypothetical protein